MSEGVGVRAFRGPLCAVVLVALLLTTARTAAAGVAPSVGPILAPVAPVVVGTIVSTTASFTDPDSTEHSASWRWGDGTSSAGVVSAAAGGGHVSGAHSYAAPGVYRLDLTVADEVGASGLATFEFVVVYDPSGGFVTGGGWIDSPPGAYRADPSLVGRANFGLVAKYKQGSSTPDGTTEFQFHAAGFNFHSSAYEWLVVAGEKATYRGTGSIQGRSGAFRFFASAIDGDLLGRDQPDRFRIKVFDDAGVIYDNQMGASEDADPVTTLGGGSIVIHKGKGTQTVNHAPVANAGPDQSITAGAIVTLDGSASTDLDGDPLTYTWTLVSKPAGSTATLTGANTATPQFTADLAGTYVASLTVNDGAVDSAPDQVQVIASVGNRAPIATDDAYNTNEDTPLVVAVAGVLANDADADGNTLTAALVSGPSRGTLTLLPDGSFTYASAPNFAGSDSFTYLASDGSLSSSVATVAITVIPVNDPPTGLDDTYATAEDSILTVFEPGVLANDDDVDGDTLTAMLVTGPSHGTLTLHANGSFTYTPAADFSGTDTMTYRASDGLATSPLLTLTILVGGENDPPSPGADTATTAEDVAVSIDVLANDSDPDGDLDPTSLSIATPPAHGTAAVDATTHRILYTPAPDYNGADSFTYAICDATALCETANVAVTITPVNDAPVAIDDAHSVDEDATLTVAAPGVLTNDADVDGEALTAILVTGPTHGGLALDPSGMFSYEPAPNFSGTDSFTYRAQDASLSSNIATVTITVVPVTDAPDARDDSASTAEDTPVSIDVLSNDTDRDGDLDAASLAVTIPAAHGAAVVDGVTQRIVYTPAPDFHGADAFTYRVCDLALSCDTALVTITLTPVNDPPTVNAGPDRALVAGEALTLIASFTDVDAGDTHAAAIDWGDGSVTPAVVDEAAKTVTGTHAYAQAGTFTITVTVTDGLGASASDTASAAVAAANNAPTANDDSYSTSEDAVLIEPIPGVLGNDTDADGNALTATLGTGPAHGTLTLNANGSFTYTPEANYFGPDSFTYAASDGTLTSGLVTARIGVAAVNDAPVALDDSATTAEDTAVAIDVLANDTDVESDVAPGSLAVTIDPAHGTAVVDAVTHRITYTPALNFHGTDTFTYQVCDSGPLCGTALVTVSVTPVNDPPVANAGADQTKTVGELATLDGSASDPDGDTVTYEWAIELSASLEARLFGSETATPGFTPDVRGLYRFKLTVTDSSGASSTDTVDLAALGIITLTPDPLNMPAPGTDTLTATIEAPAGPGGLVITLVSADPTVAAVPESVTIPAGATSAPFAVTTFAPSTNTTVTASAAGFAPDSAAVGVGARVIILALEDELVGEGRTTDGTVTLSIPAPAGGITITLVMANTGIATVSPTTLTIPAGQSVGTFTVFGVHAGVTTLTGTSPDALTATAEVRVTDALISIGNIPELGIDETEGVPISLTKPAPPGDLVVTLTTDDPNIATVSPTSTVPAGGFLPPANPQVTGHAIGTTEITAKAPGFAPGRRNVTVRLLLSFTPTSLSLGANTNRDITLLLSHTAPIGGLTVNLSTDHPNIATVPATVTFPAGQTSVVISVHGVATGNTTLRASAPSIPQVSAPIIVGAPITLSSPSVGKDLQVPVQASLPVPAPAGNLLVTFTSSDPSKLLLSASQTAAGDPSGIVTVSTPAGQFFSPVVYFQALASTGSVTVTASALGYTNGVSTVTLTPSGFWTFAPGFASAFTTQSLAPNTNILVRSVRLTAAGANAADQEVRGGLTVSIPVTSSVTSVGMIVGSPLQFVGGTGSSKQVAFDPVGPGVSVISIPSPVPGFTTPTNLGQTVTATVEAPDALFANITSVDVGKDLQVAISVFLEGVPPSPVPVTVTAANGGIVHLSASAPLDGTSSVTFANVASTSLRTLFVQGLATGSTVLTVSAPGYNSSTITANVTPSGFWIFAPGFAQAFTTNSFAAPTNILIRSNRLTAALASAGEQEVRGGLTVNVPVTSSNLGVGTITTSPVPFVGGSGGTKITQFDPVGPGTSTLAIPSPVPGFSIPSNLGQSVVATVEAPDVLFFNNPQNGDTGKDLQLGLNPVLESTPPAPVDITVTIAPGGESIIALTKVRTAAGSTSVTYPGVASTALQSLWVQGLALGSTSITVSAPGYNSKTLPVTVTQSGFWIFAPGFAQSFTTNTFAAPSNLLLRSFSLSSTTPLVSKAELEVRGGTTVNVSVTSSNTTVGTITTSPVVFAGGTGTTKTTTFDPQVVGTSTLTLVTPSGFATPTNLPQTVLATVRAPEVRIQSLNVSSNRAGRDLQYAVPVTLEDAPPEPVDVVLTVAPGGEGIVSITKTQAALGTNTVTFTGVTGINVGTIWVQGRAIGSTQLSGVAAGYNDATHSVTVDPSGFYGQFPGFATTLTTTVTATNTTVIVKSARLDPITFNVSSDQELRGGLTVNVSVTSTNTAVGVITTSPLVFTGGGGTQRTTLFDPLSAGATTVQIPAPVPGFSTPSNWPPAPAWPMNVTVNP